MRLVNARRWLHLAHRWLGIGLGIMVLLWFISGLVMLFVARPQLTEVERLQSLPLLEMATVRLSPLAAWQRLGEPGWPETVRLNLVGGQPSYQFLSGGRRLTVDAVGGERLPPVSPAAAKAAALAFVGSNAPAEVKLVNRDQWTVYASFNALRPFYRVDIDDAAGHAIYVSQQSGEVVLDSEAWERGWNWLGSVIHWMYFTPLREIPGLSRYLVLGLSFAALLLSLSGYWLGIQRLRLRRPYPDQHITPYRSGWKRWHHLVGLAGGLFLVGWLFSGWLSLAPFGWLSGGFATRAERQVLAGGMLDAEALASLPLLAAGDGVREVQWLRFAGQAYAQLLDGETTRLQALPQGEMVPHLRLATIVEQARRLRPATAIVAADWLTAPDGDYFPHRHQPRPLPVVRIRLADAEKTVFYINPATTRLEARVDSASRWHRWLFSAIHRFDFPPLGGSGPARDLTVVLLALLGATIALAGCVLGWRRITRQQLPGGELAGAAGQACLTGAAQANSNAQ